MKRYIPFLIILIATGCGLIADSFNGGGGSGSGSGAVTQISKVTTTASATTVTFSSIPGTSTDLLITYSARTQAASNTEAMTIAINGDATAGNYSSQFILAQGVAVSGNVVAGATSGAFVANIAGTTSDASFASAGSISIQSYAATTFFKRFNVISGNAAGTNDDSILNISASWKSTSAITSIVLSLATGAAFVNGSVFTLYGYQ